MTFTLGVPDARTLRSLFSNQGSSFRGKRLPRNHVRRPSGCDVLDLRLLARPAAAAHASLRREGDLDAVSKVFEGKIGNTVGA